MAVYERRADALIRAGLLLASELSLPAVLQKIVEIACEVAEARYGALGVLSPEGDHILEFITHGISEEERRRIGDLPHGRGILGVLITDARPLRLERIQEDPRSSGFPSHHPPMTTFLGVPVSVRGRVFGNLYLTEKTDGRMFDEQDEQDVVTLAAQAAVAIENARLYEDAQRRQHQLAAVIDVSQAILEGRPTDEVLRMVARNARELLGAAVVTLSVPAGEGEAVVAAADGLEAPQLQGRRYSLAGSIAADVLRSKRVVVVPDLGVDPRASQPLVSSERFGPAVFLPLAAGDEPFGTLAIANERGGAGFLPDQLAVVDVFAAQAAVALEYARVRAELERLALVEERERIARELHDGVVQALFAVGMSLQAAEVASTEDPTKERIASAVDGIDAAIRSLRDYIFGLRPGARADTGLARELRAIAQAYDTADAPAIQAAVSDEVAALLTGRASEIALIAKEAVSNAVRHARARRVFLELASDGTDAIMRIRDDGAGFDADEAAGEGHGLGNMAERARALGGSFAVESGSGRGTTVTVRLPLR